MLIKSHSLEAAGGVSTVSIIFYQLVVLMCLASVGWVLAKTGKMPDEKPLMDLLSYAAFPAMAIYSLQVPFSPSLLMDIGLTAFGFVVITVIGALMGALLGVIFRRPASVTGAWAVCVALSNAIGMGRPVMLALYGEQIIPLTGGILAAIIPGTFLLSAWLFSFGRAHGERLGLKKLLLQPTIIAFFCGILLFVAPFQLPGYMLSFLDMIVLMIAPLSMMVIGIQLERCSLRETFLDAKVYWVIFTRLIPVPVATYFLLRPFIANRVILGVLIIGASMPSAGVIPLLAAQYDNDALFCSKVVFMSTLFCVLTIPLLTSLLMG